MKRILNKQVKKMTEIDFMKESIKSFQKYIKNKNEKEKKRKI
jgi:glutaredoxin